MSILSSFAARLRLAPAASSEAAPPVSVPAGAEGDVEKKVGGAPAATSTPAAENISSENRARDESPSKLPSEDLQRGVRQVEAVTLAWSKWSLIAVFLKYVSPMFIVALPEMMAW